MENRPIDSFVSESGKVTRQVDCVSEYMCRRNNFLVLLIRGTCWSPDCQGRGRFHLGLLFLSWLLLTLFLPAQPPTDARAKESSVKERKGERGEKGYRKKEAMQKKDRGR